MQYFVVPRPTVVRYLKLLFLSFYGKGPYCTVPNPGLEKGGQLLSGAHVGIHAGLPIFWLLPCNSSPKKYDSPRDFH